MSQCDMGGGSFDGVFLGEGGRWVVLCWLARVCMDAASLEILGEKERAGMTSRGPRIGVRGRQSLRTL